MPAVDYERPSTDRASPPPSVGFTKGARLPPRHRNSSFEMNYGPSSTASTAPSSTSSVAGISIVKPVKAPASSAQRGKSSFDFVTDPFEAHLEEIYAGHATIDDGLAFFETHGYYDVSEANTMAMFRQNMGMKKQFWDGDDHDILFYQEINLDTVDLAGLQVLSAGSMLSKNVNRARSTSGRFQLLDDEGNEIDPESQLEAEREKRIKLKHLELDDDDLADLAQEQLVLAKAITVIRTEKTRFQRYFFDACSEEMQTTTAPPVVIPQPAPTLSVQMPPYSGYLYVLKDSIPHLFRSWHKRWIYLDFNTGLAKMYKRSYWKSARGELDMRTVINITRMNQSDVCVQCFDGRSMLLRSKIGAADADLWVNLLQAARRQVGGTASPGLPQLPPSTTATALTQQTTTTTTTTMMTTMATGSKAYLVSTKLGAQNERSVLDMMAVLLEAKTTTNTITAA